MENNWIGDLVARKKHELENKRFRDEKDLSDRGILNAHCDAMWSEIWESVERAVKEYNDQMGGNSISFDGELDRSKFSLRVGTQSNDVRLHRERWILASPWEVYTLTVIEGNGVVWQVREGRKAVYTSEQVACQLLERAIR